MIVGRHHILNIDFTTVPADGRMDDTGALYGEDKPSNCRPSLGPPSAYLSVMISKPYLTCPP